jgi:hypothetical protein
MQFSVVPLSDIVDRHLDERLLEHVGRTLVVASGRHFVAMRVRPKVSEGRDKRLSGLTWG